MLCDGIDLPGVEDGDLDPDADFDAFGEVVLRDMPEEGLDWVRDGDLVFVIMAEVCLGVTSDLKFFEDDGECADTSRGMERSLDCVRDGVFFTSAWHCIFPDPSVFVDDLLEWLRIDGVILDWLPTTDFDALVNFDVNFGVLAEADLAGVLYGDLDLAVTDKVEAGVLGDTLLAVFIDIDGDWSLDRGFELLRRADFGTDLFEDAFWGTLSGGDLGALL